MHTDTGKEAKILLIEDEMHIAEGIALNLKLKGHRVDIAENGRIGLEKWKLWSPDLIILDLMMPEVDGNEVLDRIRSEDEKVPVLILSAKDALKDKIRCFNRGVDDYLPKPFDLEELLLRVERLLVRARWGEGSATKEMNDSYEFGEGNVIDFTHGAGRSPSQGEFTLTAQELKVLKAFIENEGRPLSRQELLEKGWGYDQQTSTRTVDNFLVRFRKYFENDPKDPRHFKSVRSIGYIFSRYDSNKDN